MGRKSSYNLVDLLRETDRAFLRGDKNSCEVLIDDIFEMFDSIPAALAETWYDQDESGDVNRKARNKKKK